MDNFINDRVALQVTKTYMCDHTVNNAKQININEQGSNESNIRDTEQNVTHQENVNKQFDGKNNIIVQQNSNLQRLDRLNPDQSDPTTVVQINENTDPQTHSKLTVTIPAFKFSSIPTPTSRQIY